MVESVACYGSEVWLFKTEEHRKLLALEIDYLRRSARVSGPQKIPNTAIRNKTQAERLESIIEELIEETSLDCGNVKALEMPMD